METSTLLTTGAITLISVLAFETWFRVASIKEIEKKQQEIEQAKRLQTA